MSTAVIWMVLHKRLGLRNCGSSTGIENGKVNWLLPAYLPGLFGNTSKAATMVGGKFGNAAGFSGNSYDIISIDSEPEKIDGEKISIEKVEVHVDYK